MTEAYARRTTITPNTPDIKQHASNYKLQHINGKILKLIYSK